MSEVARELHFALTRHVVETGHAPDLATTAQLIGRSEEDTKQGLRELEAMRGVILVPNSFEVWSLHPFALMPTSFWVTSGAGGWWANCAWCSLAIGAALRRDTAVTASEGAQGEQLQFRVEGGRASRSDLLMHFPTGPKRWWDNPYCPCGNILFFTSRESIEAWCVRHGRPMGAVLAMETAIRLAELWFGDYAAPEWQRKTPEQAEDIFVGLGLEGEFWKVR